MFTVQKFNEVALVCVVFLGFGLNIDDDAEVVDMYIKMCDDFKRFKRECYWKGWMEGWLEAWKGNIVIGMMMGFVLLVKALLKMKKNIAEICKYTALPEKFVNEIALFWESQKRATRRKSTTSVAAHKSVQNG